MKIEEFLKSLPEAATHKGMRGLESTWLEVCALRLPSAEVFLGDPSDSSGFRMKLSTPSCRVEMKLIAYGREVRVSRLRLTNGSGSLSVGLKIADICTDSASILICDGLLIGKLSRREPLATEIAECLITEWDHYALLDKELGLMVRTGFGDGRYDLVALDVGSAAIGVEAVFIEPNTPYPFELQSQSAYPGQEYIWSLIENLWDPLWKALKEGDQATIRFLSAISPGRRGVLCLDIFNKDVLLLEGLRQFVRFQHGATVLAGEIGGAYRLLGADDYAEQFGRVHAICAPILEAKDPRAKMKEWQQLAFGPNAVIINEFERWFKHAMTSPRNGIERYIERYVRVHSQEFSGE